MNIEYNELKKKEVVNLLSGKSYGRTTDLVIDCEKGEVRGIIVPGDKSFSIFKNTDKLYIPWKNVKRIGDDIVLVDVIIQDVNSANVCEIESD